MPFDGLGYIATEAKPSRDTQPSLWERIGRFVWGVPGSPGLGPATAFQPLLPGQADNATLQHLMAGRCLIEERKNWVQRRYETRDGRRCAVGALRGAARLLNMNGAQGGANAILLSVAMSRGFNDIESMNDNSSHRQVLSAFDEAIARARL
jgi:hypothetical protein